MNKQCTKCDETKPVSEFYRSVSGRDGLRGDCKNCVRARARRHQDANPEKKKANNAKWRNKNPYEAYLASTASRFGMPTSSFRAWLESQVQECSICSADAPGGRGRFHADHCHDTGRLRGLLCHACNIAIGNLKDDCDLLEKAIEYLRKHQNAEPSLGS